MFRKVAVSLAALALAACGQKSAAPAGAVLEGNVQGASALTVSVPSTPLSTKTDAVGHFALVGVPEGTSDLHFSGEGVEADLHLSSSMSKHEHRQISVSVSGHDASEHPEQGERELRGSIQGIAAPNLTLASGQVVATTTSTVFRKAGAAIAFADLNAGDSIEAEGVMQADASLLARTITVEDASAGDDDGDSDAEQGEDVHFQGALNVINAGDLTVGTTLVHTDASTRIEKNDQVIDASGLAVNDQLNVEGALQSDGSVLAKEIKVLSEAEQDDVELAGPVSAVTDHSFTIGTSEIQADAATLAAIAVGDMLDVEAARKADGSLVAVKVEKLEQPEMNETEVEGPIQAIDASSLTVQGKKFSVDASTEIRHSGDAVQFSSLKLSQNVQVRGEAQADGSLHATRISF